jgi:Caspase domain
MHAEMLAIIDACRDNPFKSSGRSIGSGARGLAPTTAATGQMVVFSAGNGQQALDKLGPNDKEKNGLFTRLFIKEMHKSGITIDQLVRSVRSEVVKTAKSIGHDQVPAIYDQVVGDYYFKK